MMKVVVLGCGPAGLLAAQGAADAGADVTIYSKRVPSFIAGAQFIHVSIPGIKVQPAPVTIQKRGTAEGYAKKVYGEPSKVTSFSTWEDGETIAAWPMREVYDILWRRWRAKIVDGDIDSDRLDWIEKGASDMLVSTIPAPVLCRGGHIFETQEVDISTTGLAHNKNVITYNGNANCRWFRSSFLFGMASVEYGIHPTHQSAPKAAPMKTKRIRKPQWTDCDCRDQWRRVGRYGKWQRGVLAHSAYEEVFDVLSAVH
jgi:hypothetical protein